VRLGRIVHESPDGPEPRLVAVDVEGEQVVDLRRAERVRLERRGAARSAALRLAEAVYPSSTTAAISAGSVFREAAAETVAAAADAGALALDSVRWTAPVDPPLVRDCLAFRQHIENISARAGREPDPMMFELPGYYKGAAAGLIGHEAVATWPPYAEVMDYELELGFVVGTAGRNLTPDVAMDHLFGVTIYNDFSARDMQVREMRLLLGPAKGKDFATAVGPWITTTDEVDVGNLDMRARVNGEEWSHGSSSTLWWSVPELLAYLSWGETLQAGELIGSGTVGLGCGAELGRFLNPGDVVELEVSGIGVLRNTVGRPEPRTWSPTPRERGA
jgi:2-keto-4-pentenoate hydratase/2-oxohepta-3-ene-1,7-dioic acid hydratase in catechol pathway